MHILAASVVTAALLSGIPVDRLFPDATFDPAVPTQRSSVGFDPGARPLRHDELLRYLEQLADVSPRATLIRYSGTHEGRPMVVLAVSDEATIASLDEFREAHALRTDPRTSESESTALQSAKAVAWMAYGIHGDELSSVDAAAALAYRLVAGRDELSRRIRGQLVVLIDPCENPDGRERFLAQTTSFAHKVPNPDTDDLSHTTVWPWGRGNHYLFDLNRDWFSMVHPESRRSAMIAAWNPQLVVDSHEMGAHDTYLFSPPRHPFNPHVPEYAWSWGDRFAADQAKALDRRGYGYYTREWNEEFFPGYGSSWASYRGAVGILYEMSSTEGTLVKQRAGVTRTYAQAVEHQAASSIANLTTLVDNRAEMLSGFVEARRRAMREARDGLVAAWVLVEGRDPERARRLVRLLRDQGIEVLRAESTPPSISGLRDARTGAVTRTQSIDGQAWLVPVDQPAAALVRVLLDPHVPMEAAFFQEEREYLERGLGTRLYETTAWSLPLLFDVAAHWTADRPSSGWAADPVVAATGRLVDEGGARFGWMIDGSADAALPAVSELLQRGIAVRVAAKPFSVGGREYDRGSFLVKREGNPDGVAEILGEVAGRNGIDIVATGTAKAESGPDLGGGRFRALREPRIGIWTGSPVSPSSYGALWHLLDEVLGLRFSGLELARFNRTDLSRYNVLVFPPVFGSAGSYRELLGADGLDRLKRWVEGGGTAVGIGSGAEFLAEKSTGLTQARMRRHALDRFPPVVLGPSAADVAAGGSFHAAGLRAPDDDDDDEDARESPAPRASLYDVAPVLGPGARPFAAAFEQGTPVSAAPVDLAEWLGPWLAPGSSKPSKEELARGDARLRRFSTRGAILRLDLDPEAWLTWGASDTLPALVRQNDTIVARPPVTVAARFADLDRLHYGGLLWPEAAGRLALTAYATRESRGRGQVILFLSEPEFRGWTLGTRRLLSNALLLGPGLGSRWSHPW